jgi:uncharacterized protein (TIGR02145 family)
LTNYVGGETIAGTKLKSSTGWETSDDAPVGTDNFEFSALPGGSGAGNNAGNVGFWWSSTQLEASHYVWYRVMFHNLEEVRRVDYNKTNLFSVRCVQD